MSWVTWPRWPPCPYMVKILKNLLLQNQLTNDLETWYVALCMWVLPRLFKLSPWVDLDPFYAKVKFGHIGFCMGKVKIIYFLETIAALGLKLTWSIQLNEFMKLGEYSRSRSFFDLGQRSLRFQSSNLFFSKTVRQFGTKVHMKAWRRIGMKISTNELGHMIKMAAMPIYG